jgi:hypothetical protein
MDKTIHQIIAATNMFIVRYSPSYPFYETAPLAAFALVSNPMNGDETKWVEGVGGSVTLEFVEDSPNFMAYAHARDLEDEDHWTEMGVHRMTAQ